MLMRSESRASLDLTQVILQNVLGSDRALLPFQQVVVELIRVVGVLVEIILGQLISGFGFLVVFLGH